MFSIHPSFPTVQREAGLAEMEDRLWRAVIKHFKSGENCELGGIHETSRIPRSSCVIQKSDLHKQFKWDKILEISYN